MRQMGKRVILNRPGLAEQQAAAWERALRVKVAFICMAAVAGKEGDLKHLTDDLVHFCEQANAAERERCATVALEQRCERDTPWDGACTTIADKIRAR